MTPRARCWTVFARKAICCASEAWRMAYGQMATRAPPTDQARVTHILPDGITELLDGWHYEQRAGGAVFIGPGGEEVDMLTYATVASKHSGAAGQKNARATAQALTALRKELGRLREGEVEDPIAGDALGVTPVSSGKVVYHMSSQLDDWLYRGDHPSCGI